MDINEYLTDNITLCDINEDCTECPRYGDDCDGRAEEDGESTTDN